MSGTSSLPGGGGGSARWALRRVKRYTSFTRSPADPIAVGASRQASGAHTVAEQALSFCHLVPFARPAPVNGTAGVIVARGGQPVTLNLRLGELDRQGMPKV
jgi:hypothetical protein